MDIPPGERRYEVTDTFALDVDVDLYTIQPHAHLLAKEVRSYASLPDGSRKWLIYIREWDFNWQGVFRYARPQFLPAGTTITFEFVYDNSAHNLHNPHRPPRRVTYGQHTNDEMAELWLQVVTRNPADRPRLARAARERIVREEIVGVEKRLETDPDNATLHDDVALLHAEAGHVDRTAEHFARHGAGAARFRRGPLQPRKRAVPAGTSRRGHREPEASPRARSGLCSGTRWPRAWRCTRRGASLRPRSTTGAPCNSTRATWTRALTWRSRFDNCWPSIQTRRSSRESWLTSSVRSRLNQTCGIREPQSRSKEEICPGDS